MDKMKYMISGVFVVLGVTLITIGLSRPYMHANEGWWTGGPHPYYPQSTELTLWDCATLQGIPASGIARHITFQQNPEIAIFFYFRLVPIVILLSIILTLIVFCVSLFRPSVSLSKGLKVSRVLLFGGIAFALLDVVLLTVGLKNLGAGYDVIDPDPHRPILRYSIFVKFSPGVGLILLLLGLTCLGISSSMLTHERFKREQ